MFARCWTEKGVSLSGWLPSCQFPPDIVRRADNEANRMRGTRTRVLECLDGGRRQPARHPRLQAESATLNLHMSMHVVQQRK